MLGMRHNPKSREQFKPSITLSSLTLSVKRLAQMQYVQWTTAHQKKLQAFECCTHPFLEVPREQYDSLILQYLTLG